MRLLAIFILLIFSIPADAETYTGQVVSIHDGDTATVLIDRKQMKCRLAEIDAPELRQPHGYQAKRALSDLIHGRAVTVVDEGHDRYGRHICHLYTFTKDVSRQMVRQGWAWVYPRYNTDLSLPAVQAEAQREGRGIWRNGTPEAPWDWRERHRH